MRADVPFLLADLFSNLKKKKTLDVTEVKMHFYNFAREARIKSISVQKS